MVFIKINFQYCVWEAIQVLKNVNTTATRFRYGNNKYILSRLMNSVFDKKLFAIKYNWNGKHSHVSTADDCVIKIYIK